ncbi:NAD(P)H-binding protein [Parasalinivibrio latis]|uniref:NmrA family NAD(P)-binding protein n=1 Tax=Parasalinivibrio latis TaxID=2952610 RepID=UPI0030E2F7CA
MTKQPILIIGKNGKTGARVNARLNNMGFETCAVSRSASPGFDWEDSSTWVRALEGMKSAYVTFQPDLAVPSAAKTIQTFLDQAKEAGLEHIVLLSGRGEAGARRAEEHLEASGMDWNVVRASWFMQNFSESFMMQGIMAGELVLPAGEVPEPFVDADDIADVAVAALTQPVLRNRVFEVTGPQAMTFSDCVEAISLAAGFPVTYKQVPIDAFIAFVKEQGAPDEMLWLLRELFTEVLDGRNSQTVNGVEEALGRPATSFRDYVIKTAKTGVWNRNQ